MDTLLDRVLSLSDKEWQMLFEQRRFWKQVDRSKGDDACWPWMGCDNGNGYGIARINKKTNHAHRVAYILSTGEILKDRMIIVRHKCDNKMCCNPKHLELGTHADNVSDWQLRLFDQKGEHNFAAKLTEEQVKEIRQRWANGEQQKNLAVEFGVNAGSINQIVHGWTWKHSFVGRKKIRKHRTLKVSQVASICIEYNPKTMSQNALAKKYGVSRATIRRVLIGEYR